MLKMLSCLVGVAATCCHCNKMTRMCKCAGVGIPADASISQHMTACVKAQVVLP